MSGRSFACGTLVYRHRETDPFAVFRGRVRLPSGAVPIVCNVRFVSNVRFHLLIEHQTVSIVHLTHLRYKRNLRTLLNREVCPYRRFALFEGVGTGVAGRRAGHPLLSQNLRDLVVISPWRQNAQRDLNKGTNRHLKPAG